MRSSEEMLLAIAILFVAGVAADAKSFLETSLPIFTSDNAAQKISTDGGYSDVAVLLDGTIVVAHEPDGPSKGFPLLRFNSA